MICDLRSSGQEAGQSNRRPSTYRHPMPVPPSARGLSGKNPAGDRSGRKQDGATRLPGPDGFPRQSRRASFRRPLGPACRCEFRPGRRHRLPPGLSEPCPLPVPDGPEDLVLETPGRPPRDPQAAHQLQSRHPVLGLGDQIYGQKPGGQRQLAGLEQRMPMPSSGSPSRYKFCRLLHHYQRLFKAVPCTETGRKIR